MTPTLLTLAARFDLPGRRPAIARRQPLDPGRQDRSGRPPRRRAGRRPRPGERRDHPGVRQRSYPPRPPPDRAPPPHRARERGGLAPTGHRRPRRSGAAPDARVPGLAEVHVRRAIEAGTTLIADTTADGQSWDAVASSPIRGVVFHELIGLKRARGLGDQRPGLRVARPGPSPRSPTPTPSLKTRPGLSPHAPYSTAGWLYERAALSKLPALHPPGRDARGAGTPPGSGQGPLRHFLEDLGAWDEGWEPVGPSPADYVRRGDLRQGPTGSSPTATTSTPPNSGSSAPTPPPGRYRGRHRLLPPDPRPVRPRSRTPTGPCSTAASSSAWARTAWRRPPP